MVTRITGGNERGRKLHSTKSSDLRPTSEKVRSAIFSIVGQDAVREKRALDLYAGIGTLGIEALSRQAAWVDFVEANPGRCRDIKTSLRELGMNSKSQTHRGKSERILNLVDGKYDLVFADPPYDLNPWDLLMNRLEERNLLSAGALVVAEHSSQIDLKEKYGKISRFTKRHYGDTSISIYRAETHYG